MSLERFCRKEVAIVQANDTVVGARAEAVMETQLPGPRPCTMCRSERSDRVKMLIVPRLGRIELSSREILAAVFECKMSAPAITLPAGANAQDTAKLLRLRNVGCLPLLDRGRLVGVVTVSDLLALLGKGVRRVQAKTRKWTMPNRGPTHRPEPRRP